MSLVVVSDCSPVRALHHLGLLWIFETQYGRVVIPPAVEMELRKGNSACPAIDVRGLRGFEIRSPAMPGPAGIPPDLDPGEAEAIQLALELPADLLVIDERRGTEVARGLGLATIGVIGVLLEARRRGQIARLIPCVDRLVLELRFFVSPALRVRLAELAGEAGDR